MEAVKRQVMRMIEQLPETAIIDDVLAEMYFKSQVDAGLKELDAGKGIPHQKARERISKWLD